MDEFQKYEKFDNGCNVYITVNCGKNDKEPCQKDYKKIPVCKDEKASVETEKASKDDSKADSGKDKTQSADTAKDNAQSADYAKDSYDTQDKKKELYREIDGIKWPAFVTYIDKYFDFDCCKKKEPWPWEKGEKIW